MKNKYHYNGPIYHNGINLGTKDMYTWASSPAQAYNNFRYKIANGDIIAGYDLVEPEIKIVNKIDSTNYEPEEVEEVSYCDNCGTRLNDAGECPVCDLNDEEVMWDRMNELDD